MLEGGAPAVGGTQLLEPLQRDRCPVRGSIVSAVASPASPSYRDGSVRVPPWRRAGRPLRRQPAPHRSVGGTGRSRPARAQDRDPCVQRVAVLGGRPLPSVLHSRGQPRALVLADLAQDPGPGLLTDLSVLPQSRPLAQSRQSRSRQHLLRVRGRGGRPRPAPDPAYSAGAPSTPTTRRRRWD